MGNRPVHVVRFGMIKACVWRNQTRSGERHSVTLVRIFRDGDRWRESTRFGRDDLLLAAKAADHAHTWICRQREESTESSPAEDGENQ